FVLTWPIILTLRVSSLKMKGSQAGTDSHYTKSICQVSDFVKGFGQKNRLWEAGVKGITPEK
ncbi:MAG: hypothetical protein O9329_00635, partial [Microcystis sp. LE19-12.2C]|nr:hypothetical protein [Microcystis sp. LE19-12.2C]